MVRHHVTPDAFSLLLRGFTLLLLAYIFPISVSARLADRPLAETFNDHSPLLLHSHSKPAFTGLLSSSPNPDRFINLVMSSNMQFDS